MAEDYQYKLIKTFWFTVRKAGLIKENADAFVFSKNGKSLKLLTIDELEDTVRELISVTKVNVYMPTKPRSRKNKSVVKGRIELASPGQLDKIEILAKSLGLSDGGVLSILKKMGWEPDTPIGLVPAQKTIEVLKSMNKRGWEPGKEARRVKIPGDNSLAWN
jgi:hypothetical protein